MMNKWYKRIILPIAFLALWAFFLCIMGGPAGMLLAVVSMVACGASIPYVIMGNE